MPFTPYHFGPSVFIGLVFRKWLDIPVFVFANVVVDIEVLVIAVFGLGYPAHRYCHTFLVGAVLGLLWGAAAYPLRHIFNRLMQILRIPYQTSFLKMVISGVLGVWLHVLIDGICHFGAHIFWPSKTIWLWRTMYRHINAGQIKAICLFFLLAAVMPYLLAVRSFLRDNKIRNTDGRK
jgi:membrane-bound metal-dependent hydrolase YbcI (DUF457 family)